MGGGWLWKIDTNSIIILDIKRGQAYDFLFNVGKVPGVEVYSQSQFIFGG